MKKYLKGLSGRYRWAAGRGNMGWQLARLERGHSGKEYTCDNTLDSARRAWL